MTEKLGLRVVIDGNEKDLDDIFLKISDYNTNQSDYQSGEAVVLTQETGIKYIDGSDVKRDLIERYIGYDSDGYVEGNYEAYPNRIDASDLNKITDTNGNNLVNLFYQLGTKKKGSENLIEISNGIYHLRLKKSTYLFINYHFNFNFPINTIICMGIGNNLVYVKNNNKTTTFLNVTYDYYNISSSYINLHKGRHQGGTGSSTFLRIYKGDWLLTDTDINKFEGKYIITA